MSQSIIFFFNLLRNYARGVSWSMFWDIGFVGLIKRLCLLSDYKQNEKEKKKSLSGGRGGGDFVSVQTQRRVRGRKIT